ncbi:pentatricopeptide repeat-containing protein At3g48250, chloroplastic [Rhodamnia argentea]|uniref:Pentatricopeptide repeat-containing protein At3g48250, chloroplastic n=1 Tax=Rhodamnia argentea TaxID=178133 RepID=A0A8B8Q5D6_9MYRT|nr:pentatricopeptide repeat-containing protein At3g48250, chloroplastic [Rhodamnia argentea]
MMSRARAVLASIRLANSLRPGTRALLTQVSRSSPSPALPSAHPHAFLFNLYERFRFSTKPDSILDLVAANRWSAELENQLGDINPVLNHETVVYVLKKLDRDPVKASSFFHWASGRDGFDPNSSLYSMLLRILGKKEWTKQFWFTLKKMKEQGFYLDEETYVTILGVFKKEKMASNAMALTHFYKRMIEENGRDSVVKKLVELVLGKAGSSEAVKTLADMNIAFSDTMVIRILKELRNYPAKARTFFDCVGRCPDYKHNTVTYNAIARVLGREDSIVEFWSVVEEMKSLGHEMDLDTYIKVSRQFQKSKMMHDAVKLYEFMMDGPYRPSVQDCSTLLRSISATEKPDLDLVFRVARKYESTGNCLSKAAYDGIHRSLTSVGAFDEAEKIFQVMRNAGYEPDNITHSQLVFGLCKAKRLDEACVVLDKMEEHGCIPDIKTWTILIQGHCAANEVEKALFLFAKMMERGIDADADLLDVLINGFISQSKIDGAYQLFFELVNKAHIRPWQATFKNLIDKLLGVRQLDEAMELLRLMKKQNYPAYPEPFVRHISRFGTVHDASEFLKALSVKDYPSVSAYVYVLESFFKEGRQSEAKDLLYKCPHHIRQHPIVSVLFN